ncbi:MAG: ABC transporter permease, partial [Actinobacteria bacterium]|nr:ABC transporter permease [Actinomycetota bacterium]
MQLSKGSRVALRATTYLTLGVLYTPLVLVFVLSFNSERSLAWPPAGFSTRWWSTFLDVESAREALLSSTRIALIAMTIAVVLGTLLSFALHSFAFFGKNVVSFLAVLPIALPGIVTGVALRNTFVRFGVDLGLL